MKKSLCHLTLLYFKHRLMYGRSTGIYWVRILHHSILVRRVNPPDGADVRRVPRGGRLRPEGARPGGAPGEGSAPGASGGLAVRPEGAPTPAPASGGCPSGGCPGG